MSRGRIVLLYGTRPEAIKLGPVAAELRALGVQPTIICTAQHSDLLKGTPAETDLAGSCSLGLKSDGRVGKWIAGAISPIIDALDTMRPVSALVVQGDTMSAYAGALAANRMNIPIAHVEAGIRSHNDYEPWPEEGIRKAIAKYAFWHYASTDNARKNLLAEGIPPQAIRVTGNTAVSAIQRYTGLQYDRAGQNLVLITLHRREFCDLGAENVREVIRTVQIAADERQETLFLWPMHPHVRELAGEDHIPQRPRLRILPPLPYPRMAQYTSMARGVITDSGGLQEEAGVLGVPCAVMRNVTDRPESIDAGTAKLFPPTPDGMKAAIRCILGNELPRKPLDCYGTPDAAHLVASHLATLV